MNKPVLAKSKAIIIFLVFALGYFISTLLRAITATISPELVNEFNLSAGELGLLGRGYFQFANVQIPLGYMLDMRGPRKIVSYFLSLTIVGLLIFALAQNFLTLLVSRIIIGVGVGACLMGPLTTYRIWYQDETQQRANSWMLMVSAIGMLSSSLPVQFFLPIIGWRNIFLLLAFITLVCIILIIIFIPQWTSKGNQRNDDAKLSIVWQNQFFRSVIPMGFFSNGGLFAIQTLWAGPWMIKVSGYTPEESAKGLFLIYFFMLLSFLIWGYFVPKFSKNVNDAIRLLKYGSPLSLLVLGVIIYLGPNTNFCSSTIIPSFIDVFLSNNNYRPAVGMAFSVSNAGKALTSYNLLIFIGAFFLQWIIGLIIDLGLSLNYSEIASFQLAMSFVLVTSLTSYLYFLVKKIYLI